MTTMSFTTTCIVALGALILGVGVALIQGRRLRARGQRVSVVVTSNVAFGSVLIIVVIVLLVTHAVGG